MSVEESGSQFDSLSKHHPERDFSDIKFMCDAESFSDVVAILHESLLREIRVTGMDEALAFPAAIDHDTLSARSLGDGHAFAYAVDESLF